MEDGEDNQHRSLQTFTPNDQLFYLKPDEFQLVNQIVSCKSVAFASSCPITKFNISYVFMHLICQMSTIFLALGRISHYWERGVFIFVCVVISEKKERTMKKRFSSMSLAPFAQVNCEGEA